MAGVRLAFLIGLVCGARTTAPPAAVAWAARSGRLHLGGTRLAFLERPSTAPALTAVALGELVVDKLPQTGSRTSAGQLAARLASGALCGAAVGRPGARIGGLAAGAAGAALGAFATAAARSALAERLGADMAAASIEDGLAIASLRLLLGRA